MNIRAKKIISASGLGIGGITIGALWGALFATPLWLGTNLSTAAISFIIEPIGLILGASTISTIYFKYSDHTRDFLEIHVPTLKQILIAIVGLVSLLGLGVGIDIITTTLNAGGSEHQIYKLATTDGSGVTPTIVLLLVPLSILCIGPGEEIIFRGLVQKSLYSDFTTKQAIAISSVIFAILHTFAYLTAGLEQLAISLTTILILSIILGYSYAKTENIVVPALIHGSYNAVLFGLLYLELVGVLAMPG